MFKLLKIKLLLRKKIKRRRNLGFFEFKKNGKEVEYLRPGSDIISFSPYKQKNKQVIIEEEKISFTVSSDGTQLVDNETGAKYNLIK